MKGSLSISIKNLVKSYGKTKALKGISLEVEEGTVVAFLGPNGAGKTTVVSVLTGLMRQDSGEIYYSGKLFTPEDLSSKRIIGVVPQSNNLDRELSCVISLKVHGLLFGMRGKVLSDKIAEVLDLVGMTEHQHKRSNELSGGMKRRIVIARALLHDPKVLFLDEPSAGLDPVSRRSIHALIHKLNKQSGVTIFLTTHYIEEAQLLASKVFLIDEGIIVASGTPEELTKGIGRYAVDVYRDGAINTEFFDSRGEAQKMVAQLDNVESVHLREVTLEDAYITLTGRGFENIQNVTVESKSLTTPISATLPRDEGEV